MIRVQTDSSSSIIEVTLEGRLAAEELQRITPDVDALMANTNPICICLNATHFDGWDDVEAVKTHVRFIRHHHNRISKVALVAGAEWQQWLAGILSVFVDPHFKVFDSVDLVAARHWLSEAPPASLQIEPVDGSDVLFVTVLGKLTANDYEQILIKNTEKILERDKQVSFVVDMAKFSGAELSALWDDFKFAIKHIRDIRRVAVLGDQKWLQLAAKISSPLTRPKVKAFLSSDKENAIEWAMKNS